MSNARMTMIEMKMSGRRQKATASAPPFPVCSSALMERMKKLTQAAPEKKNTTVLVNCTHGHPDKSAQHH